LERHRSPVRSQESEHQIAVDLPRAGTTHPTGSSANPSFLPFELFSFGTESPSTNIRLRTLLFVRSLGIIGQIVAVFIVFFGLKYQLPITQCLMVIAVTIGLNALLLFRYPPVRSMTEREAAAHLAFDILQLTAMLALTGGIENPFTPLYLAPIVISAGNLSLGATLTLATLAFGGISFISVFHWPLPWDPEAPLQLPALYIAGSWISLTLCIGFCLLYAWRTADESRRMQAALVATQAALTKEQRLSDLGALAAATAHELGTPLGTIAVVARELERGMPKDSEWLEDVRLLRGQAERCREILSQLSQQDTEEDTIAKRLPLAALLDEIAEPHRGFGIDVNVNMASTGVLSVRRKPEIVHGLGNLIENAVDFAETKVDINTSWDAETVHLAISDDGTGFDSEILARLGEPYVTSRAGMTPEREEQSTGNAHADGHAGMGLGFFIAKTLIERIGGTVNFGNKPGGGAIVRVSFPRTSVESPAISTG
jgi:two-component system sensor histidine kinase RegB